MWRERERAREEKERGINTHHREMHTHTFQPTNANNETDTQYKKIGYHVIAWARRRRRACHRC
jgi:hypothetical protein